MTDNGSCDHPGHTALSGQPLRCDVQGVVPFVIGVSPRDTQGLRFQVELSRNRFTNDEVFLSDANAALTPRTHAPMHVCFSRDDPFVVVGADVRAVGAEAQPCVHADQRRRVFRVNERTPTMSALQRQYSKR